MRSGRQHGLWRGIVAAALIAAGEPAAAQEDPFALPRDLPVALIADEVVYDSVARRLVARGSVQVFYGERTLTADEIVYDAASDRIIATGRLVLRNPDGSTLYADYAELDAELRDGLLRSARAVLAQRFKIAAVQAERVGGRYNVLGKAVFSTCEVCPEAPVPLWRIRARRVVHDELMKTIHYEDATFDVAGVPVFYLPYFRHPDPTLERSTGFLVPIFKASDIYGYGLKTPFYWAIDPSSDATITPFVTTDEGVILEGEYRRRFTAGYLELAGSAKYEEDRRDRPFRGHLTGDGYYYVTDTVFGRFDANFVSDDGYLSDFDYSNVDRLTSEAAIASYREDGYWELGTAYFQSLRTGEGVGSIPFALPEFDLRETWDDALLGGTLGLTVNGVGLKRTGGQDVVRGTALVDWDRSWTTAQGLLLRGFAEARFDAFRVWDSRELPNELRTRFTPLVGLESRFPLIRADEGATHIIEPIAQVIWSEPTGDQALLPNEDSLLVEFDETNLFDTSRFAGYDVIEPGLRANLGLRYERLDVDGWSFGLLAGRVLRTESEPVLAGTTGLAEALSDYVGAFTLSYPPHVNLVSRVLVRDDFTLDRNELRLDLAYAEATFSGSYVYLSEDVLGGAFTEREEATGQATYQLSPNWSVGGEMTYDIGTGRFVRAGAVITYGNECVEVDFSVARRFTRSNRVNASTSVGI
ncbi:MAG TPA: LPS assembly protein LptD [Paracoccaceae bacterium]|nr:LPS assembly protein LptD [Paracoccaceae bacterium]